MNSRPEPTVDVRIAVDGRCTVDGEYFAPPPGSQLHEAVLDRLRLDAAALETPLAAAIVDEQADYTIDILVNPDGTTQPASPADPDRSQAPPAPPSPPLPPGHHAMPAPPRHDVLDLRRPYDCLPEPYRSRLKTACEAVARGHTAEVVTGVDEIILELSRAMGPRHLSVIAAGVVRGDIALTDSDYQYGLHIWSFIAQAWHELSGQQDPLLVPMLVNAVWCWSQLLPDEALTTYDTITTLLHTVNATGSEQALQNVRRRQQLLTATRHQQE
jgi:hypothetical protein